MSFQAITYDVIGNMLADGTHENVWEHGRQLESVTVHTDVVEGECMEDGYDAASGATSTIVFTDGNRVVSGTQTVTAAAQVIHGGVDITSELPASAFTWTRDSGRSAEDATWNAAHQNVKQVTLTYADMNGDVQIACSVEGDAAPFGSITVGSDYAVSYTPSAADAGDTLSLSSGILSVETDSNTYSLDNGLLKVESGFTGTVTASATVFFERPAQVMEFTYNLDGMRAEKKVTRLGVETTTSYTYSGKKLTHLICGTNSMHFFYDGQGRPSIVQYNNGSTSNNYTYVHNLQGDIVGILDSSGTLVVEYRYDSWGKPLSTTGALATTLGAANPFRYRGYIYDEETGYYYLKSRYYDPDLRRFINPDSILPLGLELCNVYFYCKNSPIMQCDDSGNLSQNVMDYLKKSADDFVYKIKYAITSVMAVVQIQHNRKFVKDKMKEMGAEDGITLLTLPRLTGWFVGMVNHGAPWDYKLESRRPKWALTDKFMFMGEEIGFHEYGNINYGATGMELYNNAEIVYKGGGYAQNNTEMTVDGFMKFMMSAQPPFYGDNEDDHYQIEIGINFCNEYPID